MNEQSVEQKTKVLVELIINLCGIGLTFVLAVIFDINPDKEYGWLMGNFHGVWMPSNWILSLFNDSVLLKAPIHTSAYNFWWWCGSLLAVWLWIKTLLLVIITFRSSK